MVRAVLIDSNWKLKNFLKNFDGTLLKVDPENGSKIDLLKTYLFSTSLLGDTVILIKSVEMWAKDDRTWLLKNSKLSQKQIIITSIDLDLLKNFGSIDDLSSPKQWDIKGWIDEIDEIANTFNLELNDEEKQYILSNVGMNLDKISNEIEKLSIISLKPTLEEVKDILIKYSTPSLFDFYHQFFQKPSSSFELLKNILGDTHPLVVLRGLEKETIVLGQLISIGKMDYSWNDIKNISRELSVPLPQISDLVGFTLGGKRGSGALKLWNLESINHLIDELQDVESKIKIGNDPVFLLLNLVSNFETVKEAG